jgi:ElaB/YqjD/DUF883 family membrane-anchored ribosome-binding protein
MNGKVSGTPGSQTESSSTKRSAATSGTTTDMRGKASEAASKLSGAAQLAVDEAKRAGSSLASEANQRVRGLLDQQVNAGADLIGQVAESARAAAQSLEGDIPQLASILRDASSRADEFSRQIRNQSASELAGAVSDFARRRPAVVFGVAAAFGFLAFRVLNAAGGRGSFGLSDNDPGHRDATDWRPDPRLGGSAYPVANPPTPGAGGSYPASSPAPGGRHTYPDLSTGNSPPISPTGGHLHGP